MKKILFLCTGNYYRSRYAEIVFNLHASQKSCEWSAFSRGLDLKKGINNQGPISLIILEHLRKKNIVIPEIALRNPLQIKLSDLIAANKIIALLESEHRPYIHTQFSRWEDSVIFWNIRDIEPDDTYDPLTEIEINVLSLLETLK